jgi:hypothetical protein
MGDIFTGDAPMLGRRFNGKEVLKVLVGDEQIWPPEQIPQYIGSLIYTNSISGAFPPHQAGDLLLVIAVGVGATPPSLPAGFEPAYNSPTTEFSMAVRVGYKIALAANTANGSWSGASWITTCVYRNTDSLFPIGAIASINTASNTVGRAPAITPMVPGGVSQVFTNFVNNGTAGSFDVTGQSIGWQPITRNSRIVQSRRLDTRFVPATTETLVGGGSVNWRGTTYEVMPAEGLQHVGTIGIDGQSRVFPPHQPGDLLVVIAQAQNTTVGFSPATPPGVIGQTYPVYTDAYDSNISPVQGANMACKVAWGWATTSNHDTGVFTGSKYTITMVFRNANPADPIGAVAGQLISAAPPGGISTPTLSLEDKTGKSLHIGWIASQYTTATSTPNPPSGWARILRAWQVRLNAAVDRKSGAACTETTTANGLSWRTVAFEVKAVGSISEPELDPWLYGFEVTYEPGWVAVIKLLDGWPEGDPDEAYFFRCSQINKNDGYKAREFRTVWTPNAYSSLDCTVEDVSNVAGKERKTITFKISPHA